MSYNIMSKNASFKGDISGTIENQVNDWDAQTIGGHKTFAASITSSADVMLSGSGKVSASFFFGNGAGLTNVASIAGSDREIQFNDAGSMGADAKLTFTGADVLTVDGTITSSAGITGSHFLGNGANLSNVTASFVTASNVIGILDAPKINLGAGLEDSSNAIQINLSSSNSGLGLSSTHGLSVDVSNLASDTSFATGKTIIVQNGTGTKPHQMTFTTIQSGLTIQGSQLGGTIDNARLPGTISRDFITASQAISGTTLHGDGAAITGVTSTPTPAGANSQIQFNNNSAMAADADLIFLTGSNTLATVNVSASSNVSGSSLYVENSIDVGGITFLNSEGNITAVGEVTASGDISSSLDVHALNFRGNGSTLSNVPLGSSNAASVVFIDNAGNQTITTNSDFTFNGTNVLNSGGGFHGTTISSSANTSIGGNLVIGSSATTLSATELGVLDGVTAGTAAASKAMVLDSDADITGFRKLISATDNGSSLELTGAVGVLQLTLEGVQYKNNTNTSTARFLPTGIISASADLQVGGHITGSGDLVFAGSTSKIHFDPAGSSATNGPSISTTNLTSLMIDGDNILNMQGDTNIRLRVGGGSSATHDMRVDLTETHLSSSVAFSGSSLHFQDSPSAVISSGGNTFLDNNGNIFTGGITMQPEGSLVLNFSDNSISGSGNISGSAFYGDGSNLENVQASPSHRYAYFTNNSNLSTAAKFVDWLGPSNQANLKDMRGGIIIAPTSGSIVRVSFTPTDDANVRSDGDEMILGVTRNAVNTLSVAQAQGKQLIGATGSFNKSISYYDDNNGTTNTFTGEIDFVNGNNVTGSNSFDPGDILGFAFRTPGVNTNLVGITLVLKFEEP